MARICGMNRPCRLCLAMMTAALTAGCAGYWPPVPGSKTHVVVPGDTLYSIAWDSGLDYHQLARWNRIGAPYIIRPGQRLRLYPGEAAQRRARVHVVAKGESLYSIGQATGIPYKSLARWNGIAAPYQIRPGQRLRLSPPPQKRKARGGQSTTESRGTSARKPPGKKSPPKGPAVRDWTWPAKGRVIAGYSGTSGNKGIDIAGKKGQAVQAAAGGHVVYQGSGLRGYGKLIIIKHNQAYLSAYAHCNKIYVKEGDVIKRGQTIAGMGNTGTNRVKLHFEIRYRGNPVNPMKFLPKT